MADLERLVAINSQQWYNKCMKVNLISDLHATYNAKTKKVLYHLPFKKSEKKILAEIEQFYVNWRKNESSLKTIDYKAEHFSCITTDENVLPASSHREVCDTLFQFSESAKKGFADIDRCKMFAFSRFLHAIKKILLANSSKLAGKTQFDVNAFVDYMFKKLGDFNPCKLEPADYLIVAGDLGLDNIYDFVLEDLEQKTQGKFKKILHIAGNHDHWWCGIPNLSQTKPDNVNLSHDYCEWHDGEYLFLGCTLWTPISDSAVWRIGRSMNDYRYVPGKFSPYSSRRQFEIQSTWLRNKIEVNKDKKIVVFTHHQPFEELIADDYKHNGKGWDSCDVNEAYVVMDHSLDDINRNGNIKLWCCGHTHQNFDGMLHGVHVVRNPIGYSDLYGYCPAENIKSETWYNKIIEV